VKGDLTEGKEKKKNERGGESDSSGSALPVVPVLVGEAQRKRGGIQKIIGGPDPYKGKKKKGG